MENRPLQEPIRGVADATKFVAKDPTTTHPGYLLNAFPVDENGAVRLNTRPKLAVEFSGAFGSGPVEAIGSIPRTSGVIGQYDGPNTIDTAGSARESGTFAGQCVVLDLDGSVRQLWNDTRATGITSPPTGAGAYGAFSVAWDHEDDDVGYFGVVAQYTTLTTQAVACTLLNRFDLGSESVTHTGGCFDAGPLASFPLASAPPAQEAIVCNAMATHGPYLFTVANRYIYVHRRSDAVMVQRVEVPLAAEVQGIATIIHEGRRYIVVCTTGSTNVATPVTADASGSPSEVFGEHFRSAAAVLYELQYKDATLETAVDPGGDPLRRVYMPQGTETGDAAYELHRTLRIAEYSITRPAGRLCYAICAGDASNILFVATANQGFNYDGTIGPDGSKPYLSLARVNIDAAFEPVPDAFIDPDSNPGNYGMSADAGGWEGDGYTSFRRAFSWGTRTLYNDIPEIQAGARDPGGASQPPTYWALAYHASSDTLIAAGCRPATSGTTPNVIAIRGSTGELKWSKYVGGLVNQGAVAINPLTGNVVVGHSRNVDTGTSAMVTELDLTTGDVARTWDIPDGVLYNGYITGANYQTLQVGVYGIAVNGRGQVLVALGPYVVDV